jgi:hypothetical protein
MVYADGSYLTSFFSNNLPFPALLISNLSGNSYLSGPSTSPIFVVGDAQKPTSLGKRFDFLPKLIISML